MNCFLVFNVKKSTGKLQLVIQIFNFNHGINQNLKCFVNQEFITRSGNPVIKFGIIKAAFIIKPDKISLNKSS